jgi:hypothetical protein
VAAPRPILHGVMHDISKTGPVHAKFRVLGTKGLTNSVVFTILASWTKTMLPIRASSITQARGWLKVEQSEPPEASRSLGSSCLTAGTERQRTQPYYNNII